MTWHFTLGPWRVIDDTDILALEGNTPASKVVASTKFFEGEPTAEEKANARLIASVPDMVDTLLWIRQNLHPRALGRGATDAELLAITYATMVLRQAGVLPTPELQEADS